MDFTLKKGEFSLFEANYKCSIGKQKLYLKGILLCLLSDLH